MVYQFWFKQDQIILSFWVQWFPLKYNKHKSRGYIFQFFFSCLSFNVEFEIHHTIFVQFIIIIL